MKKNCEILLQQTRDGFTHSIPNRNLMCEVGVSIVSNLLNILTKKLGWYAFTGIATRSTTGVRVLM